MSPLADLTGHLEQQILSAAPSELPTIAGELGRLSALVSLRLAAVPPRSEAPTDEVLRVSDVAKRLKQSEAWVYDHAQELPFRLKGLPGGGIKFSRLGLEKYLRRRSA